LQSHFDFLNEHFMKLDSSNYLTLHKIQSIFKFRELPLSILYIYLNRKS